MKKRGETRRTRADAPEPDMPDGFWETATPQPPRIKQPVTMRVDPDIIEFFKQQDQKGHLTRMHAVLRSYVDAQKKRHP
ncbi:BrnA antitoxin family protein [Marivita sp. GX14005]|uniref:BrnA antitoxin family protein n=1 Tax=Marivita sp. GX14005 TaxID=2942276 RepID=UPI002018D6E8|nr:BrnA antitoxin family protein [Marivita sp. GX14005]MCL3883987.1 BrnA antitoxin family protein [Marivita sp. GX14005]